MKTYDLIIIGAGPAGLTAGLYAVRSGLKTAVISKDIGGTCNKILKLENWPGFDGSGTKLMKQFHDQLKNYEADILLDEIVSVDKSEGGLKVKTKKDEFECKSLIITTGMNRRKLMIPGEEKLNGKGVSYCATCDAFFFKGKTVGVIGGSDCAAVSALALSDLCKKVYVIYRGDKLRCESITTKRLEEKENVEIIYRALPLEILGEEKVEGLLINHENKKETLKLDGVFVEIGAEASTGFIKNLNLDLNDDGEIIVDENMNTNVAGIFAAGDITIQKLKQVVVAAGQGSIAAKSAYDYISKL